MSIDHDYIAAYDVSDQRRLRRALNAMLEHALVRQKSVFELRMRRRDALRLARHMRRILNADEDRFVLLRISSRTPCIALGAAPKSTRTGYFVVS